MTTLGGVAGIDSFFSTSGAGGRERQRGKRLREGHRKLPLHVVNELVGRFDVRFPLAVTPCSPALRRNKSAPCDVSSCAATCQHLFKSRSLRTTLRLGAEWEWSTYEHEPATASCSLSFRHRSPQRVVHPHGEDPAVRVPSSAL